MSVKLLADATGQIISSSGDIDAVYGIASLSKIWAVVLIYDRIRIWAARREISIDALLDEKIFCAVDYGAKIYKRMIVRDDLSAPDDPLTYQPFRKEKARFRLPVEKGKFYTMRELFEASLFQSKNDAIQALADHFFANDDNVSFRTASVALAQKLGLAQTKIGDPHGLCDGDNVSTAREWTKFCSFIIQEYYLEFFGKFDPVGKEHTAAPLLDDPRVAQNKIQILLAKTATGNDRQGNDSAESLMVIAKIKNQFTIALAMSDEDRFESVVTMLSAQNCPTA